MEFAQLLGWTATFLFSIMIIPQMVKTIKSKDTRGVSLVFFTIFLIANIIAFTYATLIGQRPLQTKYTIAMITTIIYIGIFFYYKTKYSKTD